MPGPGRLSRQIIEGHDLTVTGLTEAVRAEVFFGRQPLAEAIFGSFAKIKAVLAIISSAVLIVLVKCCVGVAAVPGASLKKLTVDEAAAGKAVVALYAQAVLEAICARAVLSKARCGTAILPETTPRA